MTIKNFYSEVHIKSEKANNKVEYICHPYIQQATCAESVKNSYQLHTHTQNPNFRKRKIHQENAD